MPNIISVRKWRRKILDSKDNSIENKILENEDESSENKNEN